MTLNDLIADFKLLTDWEDRYRHLIELGEELPHLTDAEKIPANKVTGCTSQVWLVQDTAEPTFTFRAESDALIVNGLIAVLRLIYNGKSKNEIMATDATSILTQLGLDKHLSPNRRNGLYSMVNRVKELAA